MILLTGSLLVAEHQPLAADDWLGWAYTAWKYFTPSTSAGVHPTTGLNRANQYWGFVTDWDLATYIIAILHACDLGVVSQSGSWGASDRLDKVLRFLELRPLRAEDGLPSWSYKWDAKDPYVAGVGGSSPPGDAGRLLVSLYLVKQSYPLLATRVDAIVERLRPGYMANFYDVQGRLIASHDWYRYYDLFGFEEFGFPVEASRQTLEEALASPHVDVYGQSLARILTTAEPFLLGLFEWTMDSRFRDYAYRTYMAMEGRYNALGILTSWSESANDNDPYYVYEWVVKNTGETWQLHPPTDSEGNPYTPIVTSKGAFGYHALYHTSYTQTLLNKLLPKIQTSNLGFAEGAYEGTGGEIGVGLAVATDKTNAMIIGAARYAIRGLLTSMRRPSDGASLPCPVKLVVKVTSSGSVVAGATVKFYVDDSLVSTRTTNSKGKAKFKFCPTEGTYTWYATAEKTGYASGLSEVRAFTVAAGAAYLEDSDDLDSLGPLPLGLSSSQLLLLSVSSQMLKSIRMFLGSSFLRHYGNIAAR